MLAKLLLKSVEQQAKPAVSFQSNRCLRSRLNSNACERCLSLCSPNALTLNGRQILFSEDKCSGCMACISECPNDAFKGTFDEIHLLDAVQNNNSDEPVVLSCEKSKCHANQVAIPCIGLLSEPILATLNCLTKHSFFLDVQHCADCKNSHVLKLLHERIQGIINKSGQVSDLRIRYYSNENSKETFSGLQRRFFLHKAKSSILHLCKDTVSTLNPNETLTGSGKEVQKDAALVGRILQKALQMLPSDAAKEKELLFSYFYQIETNENCDLCPSCSGMCPTGALKRRTDEEKKKLIFVSSKCSGCGLCVDFCRKNGIALMPGVKTDPGRSFAIA